jgi:hypothetical protein
MLWFKDFLCCISFFGKGSRQGHAGEDVFAGADMMYGLLFLFVRLASLIFDNVFFSIFESILGA